MSGDDGKLGATGEYPDGKLNESDEGELTYRVAADRRNGVVHIDFGKPVCWLGLPAKEARELGLSLLRKAAQLDVLAVSIEFHDKAKPRT